MSKRREDAILQALLANRTIRDAAVAAHVSERVVYDYLKDPAFSTRYQTARDDIMRGVSNNLRGQMSIAVDTIAGIMSNTDNRPGDRLAAAKTILEYGNKCIEIEDILSRLDKLEAGAGDE